MIQSHLQDIASISTLRNDALLLEIVRGNGPDASRLNKGRSGTIENALFDSMEALRSDFFRKEQLEFCYDLLEEKRGSDAAFETLSRWFRLFFRIDGDRVTLMDGLSERYATVVSKIYPLPIIAKGLSEGLSKGDFDIARTVRMCDNAIFSGYTRHFQKEYADNHLHLNGIDAFAESFDRILHPDQGIKPVEDWIDPEKRRKLPKINEFVLLNSGQLTVGQVFAYWQESFERIFKSLAYGDPKGAECFTLPSKRDNRAFIEWETWYSGRFQGFNDPVRPIWGGNPVVRELLVAAKERHLNGEFESAYLIFLIAAFCGTKGTTRHTHLYAWILCANIVRSHCVMGNGSGLKNFTSFFDAKFRKYTRNPTNRFKSHARGVVTSGASYVEGKISPDRDPKKIAETVRDIWKAFQIAALDGGKRSSAYVFPNDTAAGSVGRFHACVHFSKSGHKSDNQRGWTLKAQIFGKLRSTVSQEAASLAQFLHGTEFRSVPISEIMGITKAEHLVIRQPGKIDISNLVVAIDAAGCESDAPPEVFAPAIRGLRSNSAKWWGVSSGPVPRPFHRGLRISYHVGEDFDWIVGGLRRIDEAKKFFDMSSGDRFGHALALGVNPSEWMRKIGGEFLVRTGDYLDDLVWLRRRLDDLGMSYPGANSLKSVLEKRINKYGAGIYGPTWDSFADTNGRPGWADCYRAWKMRKYEPGIFSPSDGGNSGYRAERERYGEDRGHNLDGLARPDDVQAKDPVAFRLYRDYQYRSKEFSKRWKHPLRIGFESHGLTTERIGGFYEEIITKEELRIFEALQDMMIEDCSMRGLIIEANPSSNVYIDGTFDSYDDHPIFRWSPPDDAQLLPGAEFNRYGIRTGRMAVCVNTDDPGIFPTTLQNEFEVLRAIAKNKKGIATDKVDAWIEGLRIRGVEIFKENHLPEYFE